MDNADFKKRCKACFEEQWEKMLDEDKKRRAVYCAEAQELLREVSRQKSLWTRVVSKGCDIGEYVKEIEKHVDTPLLPELQSAVADYKSHFKLKEDMIDDMKEYVRHERIKLDDLEVRLTSIIDAFEPCTQ